MSITKSAVVIDRSETRARVFDFGVSGGLNIGHLRAFVEQADIAGLTNETHVYLTDKLQSSSPYHDVEIVASVADSTVTEIATQAEVEIRSCGLCVQSCTNACAQAKQGDDDA